MRFGRHSERDRPHAFRMSLVAAKRKEHHPLDAARVAGFHGDPEYEGAPIHRSERELKLLGFQLVPAKNARGRLAGRTSIKSDRHLVDQEHELKAILDDAQPRVFPRHCDPPQSVTTEGIGPTADGPVIITHLVGCEGDGIASGSGEQPGAAPEPLLGERGMQVPGSAFERKSFGHRRFYGLPDSVCNCAEHRDVRLPWRTRAAEPSRKCDNRSRAVRVALLPAIEYIASDGISTSH